MQIIFLQSYISSTEDIKDLKDIINVKLNIVPYLFIAIFFLILATAAFILYKNRSRKQPEKDLPPLLPPYIKALEEIRKLKDLNLIEQGMVKEFCTRLSEIIRVFLEEEYKISALDRTTYELVEKLKCINIQTDRVFLIQNFLVDCDLVKFAKYKPPKEDLTCLLEQAEKTVGKKSNV